MRSDHRPSTPPSAHRPWGRVLTLAGLALTLSGCAAWNSLSSSVSSFGSWPEGRAPGRFVFERLPSQSSQPARQAELEQLALPALQAAGFELAAAGQSADVRVMLGTHIASSAYPTWHDPFWPAPVGLRWSGSPWMVPSWPQSMSTREYRREVVLLIREHSAGPALFEARAYSTGASPGSDAVLGAMFRAALHDFPKAQPEPHGVTISLPTAP